MAINIATFDAQVPRPNLPNPALTTVPPPVTTGPALRSGEPALQNRAIIPSGPNTANTTTANSTTADSTTTSTSSTTSTTLANPPNVQSPAIVVKSSQPTYTAINPSSLPQKRLEEERRNAMESQAALIAAAKANNDIVIDKLIEKGVVIDHPDGQGYTALHHAAKLGKYQAAWMLLRRGADDTKPTKKEGYTAIMLAALKRRENIVELLADHRRARDLAAGKYTTTATGSSLPTGATRYEEAKRLITYMQEPDRVETFKYAITNNDIVMAARMIANGNMTLSECDEHGDTPLVLASKGGDVEMILLLLCNGAKTHETDKQAKSPLMHAAATRNLPAIKILLRAGADASQADVDGNNALDLAVADDDAIVLDALLGGQNGGGRLDGIMPALIANAARASKTRAVALLLKREVDFPNKKTGRRALAVMAQANQLVAVKTLLAAGANPHAKAKDGHTAFTLAAANGHKEIVKALFAHCPAQFTRKAWIEILQNQIDRQGRTALMLAVLNQRDKMFVLLSDNYADKDKIDLKGRNAMLWAAAKGGQAMVNALLLQGASPFVSDADGNTVVHAAAEYGDKDVMKFFCKDYIGKGLDINLANRNGDTPLILAARKGHLKLVNFLLNKQHAYPLHHNKQGRTAFLEAGGHNHREVMALVQQFELSVPDRYPVVEAVLKKIGEIWPAAKRLLPEFHPQPLKREDKAGNTVLHLLAANGHRELMEQLMAARAEERIDAAENPEVGEGEQTVALHPNSSAPITMRPANLDIEMLNKEGMTPLCLAARNGHYSAVSYLVAQHAQVNHKSVTGMMPLWLACRLRECAAENGVPGQAGAGRLPDPVELVRLLLEHKALVDEPSFRGQTPLMAASASGQPAVVDLLITAGAYVDHADDYGLTPLMYAAHFGHVEVATILLEEGALPNQSPGSLSALILAAESGRDDVVMLLIERGALVDHVDKYGLTALMSACTAGNETTVELLLKQGADPLFVNEAGRNAMDYAKLADHYRITRILENYHPEVADF